MAGSEALRDRQLEELQHRLDEAEETLRAIRCGEVDALLIGGDRHAEVFTLEGGTESYRTFMEAMEVGAAALDLEHRVIYANHSLCVLLDRSAETLQTSGLLGPFDAAAAAEISAVLRRAETARQATEIKLVRSDDERHLMLTAAPLRLGPSGGIAVTLTDMTERVRAAAADESERLARAVLASANEAVVVCDRDGVVSHANVAAHALCGRNLLGRPFEEAVPLVFPEMTSLMRPDDLVAMAVAGTAVQGVEASAPGAKVRDLLVSAAPLVVAGGRILGCVVTMFDLTQRKVAERQQQLLMRELDHRVKNTLTLVLSICSRTAAKAQSVTDYHRAIIGRIQALSATHNLLADKAWSDVTLVDLVSLELAPFTGAASAQVVLSGLDVPVSARAATALGLLFHELTTNAVKYGALSQPAGRLAVMAEPPGDSPSLVVVWEESGGPLVANPSRRGFGHTVISRSLAYDPAGGADLEFRPEGLRCVIRIPRQDLVPLEPLASQGGLGGMSVASAAAHPVLG